MIEARIGDYVKYKDDVLVIKKAYAHSFIGTSLNHKEDYVLGYNDITLLVDYEDYEQQKLRADDLQKQLDASERMRKRHRDNGFYLESEILKEKLRADRAEKRWSELKSMLQNESNSRSEKYHDNIKIGHTLIAEYHDGCRYVAQKTIERMNDMEGIEND